MKMLLSLCGLVLLFTMSARAELRVSSSVFTIDELAEAKAKAVKDAEPLIFVYTDPGTT
jgi:hypothetical protein